jgi:pimeloyl-ACP methyl ester carboxylesterase
MQHGTFATDGETLAYSLHVPADLPSERALSLHGAGPAGRERFRYLAEHLVSRGSSAFSFDFSGHGESTGKLRESSLARRAVQAKAAIEFMPQFPTVLIGTSMGGHVASSIVSDTKAKFLILFCPALYGDDCINVPFDERFTAAIRKPSSFEDSSVRSDLMKFQGRSLIIIGEEDKIIPPRVVEIYRQELQQSSELTFVNLPGAPHNIHGWAMQNAGNMAMVLRAIDELLDG